MGGDISGGGNTSLLDQGKFVELSKMFDAPPTENLRVLHGELCSLGVVDEAIEDRVGDG